MSMPIAYALYLSILETFRLLILTSPSWVMEWLAASLAMAVLVLLPMTSLAIAAQLSRIGKSLKTKAGALK